MKPDQEPDPFSTCAPVRKEYAGGRSYKASFGEFHCQACHGLVTNQPWLSGVQNRNHCPYCLWSRHLDLFQAGDRLSACKAGMEPIGLTLKRSKRIYQPNPCGEIMLVHRCVDCAKISINRIAADDDPEQILRVFQYSLQLDPQTRALCQSQNIWVLQLEQMPVVHCILFGKN